jgi:hypothetical protein
MKLMKYCISPNKLAWLRKELGKDADGLLAAMDAAGRAYLDDFYLDGLAEQPVTPDTSEQAAVRKRHYLWLQLRIALTTRVDDDELAAMAHFEPQHREICVVQVSDFETVLEKLRRAKILGFDTETRASFERGVQYPLSLIQIATADASYLFQHAILGERLAQLKPVLEDESVLKVGVGLRSDVAVLKREWGIHVTPRLDLNWALAQLGAGKEMGTRQLVAVLLGKRIDKPKKVTLSNWQHVPLSSAQVNYAAADALAALECFNALITQLTPFYHASSESDATEFIPLSLIAPLASYVKPA